MVGDASEGEMLEDAIRQGLRENSLGGVVLCSGVAHFNGTVEEEVHQASSGAVGLRYPVAPWRAREAIVVPLCHAARPAAHQWRQPFGTERDWLTWALDEMSLPTIDAMLGD